MTGLRSYSDPCGIARALDQVGERWALLVVRELLLGPKRFTDLRAGLPNASPNVLSQRLRELEDSGAIQRRQLPPPAGSTVYELTAWGRELQPVIDALARWGSRSPQLPPGDLSPDALMIALQTTFDPAAAMGLTGRFEIRIDDDRFSVQVARQRLTVGRAHVEGADATITASAAALRQVIFGGRSLARAKQADAEISAGKYRGPLHGIPYGVKDLLDTKDIPTTYGAEPFRNRVPAADSAVVRRLDDAGAVLLAKLSLGALALNDIWFGGQTMNPWLLEEGASGSSAGPGAATAAALVAFSIGSETGGSIVSPAMRCGVTGLRPTFGRVPRTGAMTLCWSLDKLGPMTRSVEDAMLVLQAITGPDAGDASSVPSRLDFDASAPVAGLKIGYIAPWMKENPATDVDRAAIETMKKLMMELKEVTLPDWPYSSLMPVLFAEGAASFEQLALDNQLGSLKVQVKDAWPNLFRQARFLSAVDFVQADRLRRKVALEMARIFREVDVLIVPSLRDEQLTITNFTGHPSLTLRAGFVEVSEARSDWAPDPANPLPKFNPPRRVPHGITLLGGLFDDGLIGQVGLALEQAFGVVGERPAGF